MPDMRPTSGGIVLPSILADEVLAVVGRRLPNGASAAALTCIGHVLDEACARVLAEPARAGPPDVFRVELGILRMTGPVPELHAFAMQLVQAFHRHKANAKPQVFMDTGFAERVAATVGTETPDAEAAALLARFLEYIAAELCQSASDCAGPRAAQLSVTHLRTAMSRDDDLWQLQLPLCGDNTSRRSGL